MKQLGSCIVCGNEESGFKPFWKGLEKCSDCGYVRAALSIHNVVPERIYSEDYFTGREYENYLRDRHVFERHFRERLKLVKRFQPNGRLIEIGCAYGFFLSIAQEVYDACGYDIAEKPIRYAREKLRVDAHCADFIEASVTPETVDIVVMWDTIEHLLRPDLTIKKVSKTLRSGGIVVITTGDIGSIMAKLRKSKWRLIHPPTHLHYFSKDTLAKLLQNEGMRVKYMRYVGVRRSVSQICYSLFQLGNKFPSRIYRSVVRSGIGGFSFPINMYDILCAVGQKK